MRLFVSFSLLPAFSCFAFTYPFSLSFYFYFFYLFCFSLFLSLFFSCSLSLSCVPLNFLLARSWFTEATLPSSNRLNAMLTGPYKLASFALVERGNEVPESEVRVRSCASIPSPISLHTIRFHLCASSTHVSQFVCCCDYSLWPRNESLSRSYAYSHCACVCFFFSSFS